MTTRSRMRLRQSMLAALLLLLLFAACSPRPPVPVAADNDRPTSHQRMVEVLERIRIESRETHPFLGQRPLRQARAALESRRAVAAPAELSVLHGVLGQELLRMGKTSEALQHMHEAYDLLLAERDRTPRATLQRVTYMLGVAHLREAENVNCVHCINGERCLFPIRGAGVHERMESSTNAIKYLTKALNLNHQDLPARWLLNIACMTVDEYPDGVPSKYRIPPEVWNSAPSPVGEFRNVATQLGLDALTCAGGVIADDFDNDLDFDVFFSSWETDGQLLYFRNQGDGTFADATSEANLTGLFGGLNMLQADYDNDGDMDVLVLRGAWLEDYGRHPNSLLQNDGSGRFTDVTFDVGLAEPAYPTQTAAWSDYDLDGDLDLYIGNEVGSAQLFRNDDGQQFVDVAREAGVVNGRKAKGVAWGDYDSDGWPDLYVSNLPGANRLYHNEGNGKFADVAPALGVTAPNMSFPVWFWDYDNDGQQDIYVGSFQPGIRSVASDYLQLPVDDEPDRLYHGLGGGRFEERASQSGLTRTTQPMGSAFGDIDNDGFLDFYLGTGYVDYEGLMPNLLFHNRSGERFDDVTFSARVGHLQKGHGVAFADLDNDGDQEILAEMGGWYAGDRFANAIFENLGCGAGWIALRLEGRQTNRCGIGCRVRATFRDGEESRTIYRWVGPSGSFGGSPLRLHLGVGKASTLDELEIHWPVSRTSQLFRNLPVKRLIEVVEQDSQPTVRELSAMQFPKARPSITK